MAARAFRAEKRSVQRYVGLAACDKARLWPTADAILSDARSDREDIAEQIVYGAVEREIIAHIIIGRLWVAYTSLGKMLGVDAPDGNSLPAGEARRPLTRAEGRP